MKIYVCEVRFQEDETRLSPGRLSGTLLTYEVRASDRAELFARGSLYWPDTGITVNDQHNRKETIVRAVPFLDGDAIKIDVELPDTQRGRDCAVNVRSGILTGLSVEFHCRARRSAGRAQGDKEGPAGPCRTGGLPELCRLQGGSPQWGTRMAAGRGASTVAVTVEELAISLRLSVDGLGLSAAQTAILSRYLGVGTAYIDLLIPTRRSLSRTNVSSGLPTYLHDQPLGRRDAYANSLGKFRRRAL